MRVRYWPLDTVIGVSQRSRLSHKRRTRKHARQLGKWASLRCGAVLADIHCDLGDMHVEPAIVFSGSTTSCPGLRAGTVASCQAAPAGRKATPRHPGPPCVPITGPR